MKNLIDIDIQTLNIALPKNFNVENITHQQIVEWLKFNFGICGSLNETNPLCDLELSECKNNISLVLINNKHVVI